jgi:hypothetical protein
MPFPRSVKRLTDSSRLSDFGQTPELCQGPDTGGRDGIARSSALEATTHGTPATDCSEAPHSAARYRGFRTPPLVSARVGYDLARVGLRFGAGRAAIWRGSGYDLARVGRVLTRIGRGHHRARGSTYVECFAGN